MMKKDTRKAEGERAPSASIHENSETAQSKLKKLEKSGFPDQPSGGRTLPATFENFRHLIEAYGIEVRFNLIKKRVDVKIPGLNTERQNRDEVVLTHLESLLHRNEMSVGTLRGYLLSLADANPFDPFKDWIDSRPWDGKERFDDLRRTIRPQGTYYMPMVRVLLRKWLLSIVAATYVAKGFRARGVLTLQGAQGIGKTTWIARLVAPQELRDEVVKLGHSWDRGQKDAKLSAIRHRIVELGELEGSFRHQMPGLKAFLTESEDKIRPPYGRVEAEYPRSTIFAASVNDQKFLQDATGNSRFWTIAAESIDYEHDIDMQQVFAELKVALQNGEKWWLTPEEEKALASINDEHRMKTLLEAQIEEALDLSTTSEERPLRLTAREVLQKLGYERPGNAQFKEAHNALRSLLGEPKKVNGYYRWWIAWKSESAVEADQLPLAY